MKTKIKESLSVQRIIAFICLVILVVLGMAGPLLAQTFTQGYGVEGVVQKGMIVRLKEGDASKVQAVSKEQMEVNANGSNMTIGFNPRYLLDSFKVIDDEKVEIYFSSPVGPCVVKPIQSEKFTFMILPVRI